MANWWDEWAKMIARRLAEDWLKLERQRQAAAFDGGKKPNPSDSGSEAGKPRRKRKRRTDPGTESDKV